MPYIGIPEHEQQLIEQICAAIERRHFIRFWYEDTTKTRKDWRTVEPYMVGSSHKGKIQMLGWYKSDDSEGWRLYNLANVSSFQILESTFTELRDNYNPNDQKLKTIYCKI